MATNADEATVAGFGMEWRRFAHDAEALPPGEIERRFGEYFRVFPWDQLPPHAVGFDAGCGTGRWAKLAAQRVGHLHCVDASGEALDVARANLAGTPNCSFHQASIDEMPLADGSMDFGYSLGVLHHIPDTVAGLRACVAKLKPGAPFLLYLYYAFDNRPSWYRTLWRASDAGRQLISRLPDRPRALIAEAIAAGVYWPLARAARLAERVGLNPHHMPMAYYRDMAFYTMRTDALDRFGTRLERRFTADSVRSMMEAAGLENVVFSDAPPYWCAVGQRRTRIPSDP